MIPIIKNDTLHMLPTFFVNVGDVINFKSSVSATTSIGTVMAFKYAGYKQSDTESAWFEIQDSATGECEWISVNVWLTQIINPIKFKVDVSVKPASIPDMPF